MPWDLPTSWLGRNSQDVSRQTHNQSKRQSRHGMSYFERERPSFPKSIFLQPHLRNWRFLLTPLLERLFLCYLSSDLKRSSNVPELRRLGLHIQPKGCSEARSCLTCCARRGFPRIRMSGRLRDLNADLVGTKKTIWYLRYHCCRCCKPDRELPGPDPADHHRRRGSIRYEPFESRR